MTERERRHPCPPAGAARSNLPSDAFGFALALRAQADRMSALHVGSFFRFRINFDFSYRSSPLNTYEL